MVRKAITSYYTAEEQQEIAQAADADSLIPFSPHSPLQSFTMI